MLRYEACCSFLTKLCKERNGEEMKPRVWYRNLLREAYNFTPCTPLATGKKKNLTVPNLKL